MNRSVVWFYVYCIGSLEKKQKNLDELRTHRKTMRKSECLATSKRHMLKRILYS